MDVESARWLVSADAVSAIERAGGFADPGSLQAGTALRRELPCDRAAAVLDLVALRRRARAKLGDRADEAYLTHDGLQQATRWQVARWRAEQIANLGFDSVLDLGCGLGIDALACLDAGLAVTAVECDEVTAVLAEANLRAHRAAKGSDVVIVADATTLDLVPWLGGSRTAVFCDPARRTPRGRSWDVADLSPSWEFVASLLSRAQGLVVVKLGPGFPLRLLPEDCDATWVSQDGDLVETTVWAWPGAGARRTAVVLNHGGETRLAAGTPCPAAGPVSDHLFEPDPAVIRSRAVGALAERLGAWPLAAGIAYLTGPNAAPTPLATGFAITQTLDFSVRTLRAWARDHRIGALEIKVRGLDVDPALLRRDLRLSGRNQATVVLTPTIEGTKIVVVRRHLPV